MLDRRLYDTAQAFISFLFLSNCSVRYGQSGVEGSSYEGRILLFNFASIYFVYFGALFLGAYMLITKMAPLSSFNDFFVLIKIPVCASVCTCVHICAIVCIYSSEDLGIEFRSSGLEVDIFTH